MGSIRNRAIVNSLPLGFSIAVRGIAFCQMDVNSKAESRKTRPCDFRMKWDWDYAIAFNRLLRRDLLRAAALR